MVNYWIFKVRDDSNGNETLTGVKIFNHRMLDKAWGIKEFTEKGRKTPNSGKLEKKRQGAFSICAGKKDTAFLETLF